MTDRPRGARFPGKIMPGVVALPRWAVSFENTVYVARGNRLKTVPVRVARIQGEEAFIAEGLQEGEQVIVTRLVDPLENALLTISGTPQSTVPPAGDDS